MVVRIQATAGLVFEGRLATTPAPGSRLPEAPQGSAQLAHPFARQPSPQQWRRRGLDRRPDRESHTGRSCSPLGCARPRLMGHDHVHHAGSPVACALGDWRALTIGTESRTAGLSVVECARLGICGHTESRTETGHQTGSGQGASPLGLKRALAAALGTRSCSSQRRVRHGPGQGPILPSELIAMRSSQRFAATWFAGVPFSTPAHSAAAIFRVTVRCPT